MVRKAHVGSTLPRSGSTVPFPCTRTGRQVGVACITSGLAARRPFDPGASGVIASQARDEAVPPLALRGCH